MKQCKLLHINDGCPREQNNGNWMHVEDYPRAEEILNRYLNSGYELKSMVPLVSPAELDRGNYGFYRSGFVFYLEREVEGEYTGPTPDDPIFPEGEDLHDIFRAPDESDEDDWFDDEDE